LTSKVKVWRSQYEFKPKSVDVNILDRQASRVLGFFPRRICALCEFELP